MKHGFQVAGVLVVCLIVLLSIIPGNMQIRTGAPNTVEHFAAYLLSGLILARAFGSCRRTPMVIALLIILAGALEIVQLWVPGRTADFADWEASSLGAMTGVLLIRAWHRIDLTSRNSTDPGSSETPRMS
jgi:VanZ family protein